MLKYEYKNRRFSFQANPTGNGLIVVDDDSKSEVLQCNFPKRGQYRLEMAKAGLDEDRELLSAVEGIIKLWIDQGRL